MRKLFSRLAILPLVGCVVMLLLSALTTIYVKRLDPFDGIAFDAPQCTPELVSQRAKQCQKVTVQPYATAKACPEKTARMA